MDHHYKASKEAFVSGMTGSSISHINMVSFAALSSVALHSALRTRLPPRKSTYFPLELLILVLPLLLSITLFANSPGLLNLIILFTTGLLLLIPRREAGTPLPSNSSPSRASSPTKEADRSISTLSITPLPALTTYRAHLMLLTCLSILAVDFPVFPRVLAKCETYGVSMMDLGVGSFVFSQGIVSAAPLVKNPAHLKAPLLPKLATVIRKCLPLIVLGIFRTLSVKGVEYPEHQTEYGTHWNFFFTLAAIPVLQVLLHPAMIYLPISLLGMLVALVQQFALYYGGMQEYVLTAPRLSLVSHNKEGIVSLTGYLAIHLLGLSTGTLLLPPTPSYFRRRQRNLTRPLPQSSRARSHDSDSESDDDGGSARGRSHKASVESPIKRENDKTAIELCSYTVLWWVFLAAAKLYGVGGDVSRRLANLQYIVWVAAYNTTFLLGYLCLDLLFFASPFSKSIYDPNSKLKVRPDPTVLDKRAGRKREVEGGSAPALLDAINLNGLVLFLVANVATGLVNLSMRTMYMSEWAAMSVLSVYAIAICGAAWAFRRKRLWRF
ncbi:hypothetical protein WOLCODRAFT_127895 [Wolfiporia cocos MD-104 SS10]|uniref:GPI-anchored wall transfer protein n=1 Tax=Wolfiporia cocos (strain MD-104) TaxID=742152 RepID=A0A2H3J5H5_WOLCO|nr:hypothetical protein WOLCODRAFT_127895 [Wolfiporia cocos MD-104 SS10]